MKNANELRKLKFLLLLPAGILLIKIASFSPYIVEHVYSRGVYRYMSRFISIFAGWVPISLGELLIILLILFTVMNIIRGAVGIIKKSYKISRVCISYLLNVMVFISILYFSFIITFDLNYQRFTFSQISNMDTRPASVNDLYKVCSEIVNHTNELRTKVKEDTNGVMKLSDSLTKTFKKASIGYSVEAKIYPDLGGNYSNPKSVIFSRAMSLMGIQGIHNPLTQEANINIEISDCMLPSTACHEMAHQRGFAREDEANFIAYLTCMKNPNVDFKYSGEIMALIYSMNALYSANVEKYSQLRKEYSSGVVRDLVAYRKFWQKFEGPIQNINDAVNNTYLKVNNQRDGIKSYGRMVDLLIAQYRAKGSDGL